MLLTNCFAVCSARLIFFLSICAFCFNVLLSGLVGNSLSDWTLRCITWNVNATMSSQLKSLYLQLFKINIISQLYLTMFEVVYRHTSGPSTTPNVIPQTNNRRVIVMWFGLQPPGSRALSPGFLVQGTSQTIERQSFYQTFISIASGFNSQKFSPPTHVVLSTYLNC